MPEGLGAMPNLKPLIVTLTPASEQLIRAHRLDQYPDYLQRRVAVALFSHARESAIRDLREGREVAPDLVEALNALNREIHAHHSAYPYQPFHDYRIVNRYLCSGYRTERGTVVWWASGECIPVLEDIATVTVTASA